jgi:hypothetical protein
MMYEWEKLPSRFVRHEPCPACGSKDNLARYEGGNGFCFGCGYMERTGGNVSGIVSELGRSGMGDGVARRKGGTTDALRPPPDDTVLAHYPNAVVEWVAKYGLSVADLIRHKVGWSKRREQLIYQFYGADQELVLWQARNFREGTTHRDRFFTGGPSAEVVAAYYPKQTSNTACIVEDCISAINASHAGVSGIPCLGSSMPEKKLAMIARMYNEVFVWLDEDKFKEAQRLGRQLSMLGCHTRVLQTTEDPKCYPLDFLEAKLRF